MGKKPGFKIEKITAFVAIDNDDEEGIVGIQLGDIMMPMVCADEDRIAQMFVHAKNIASQTGKPIRILQFSVREDVTESVTEKYKNA